MAKIGILSLNNTVRSAENEKIRIVRTARIGNVGGTVGIVTKGLRQGISTIHAIRTDESRKRRTKRIRIGIFGKRVVMIPTDV